MNINFCVLVTGAFLVSLTLGMMPQLDISTEIFVSKFQTVKGAEEIDNSSETQTSSKTSLRDDENIVKIMPVYPK
ncbi:MAG TPA: hypothetical protein VF220_05120 [Nitrososphaeraceae archaeon]